MRIAVISHGLNSAGGKSVATNIIEALARVRPEYDYCLVVPDDDDYRGLEYPRQSLVEFFGTSFGIAGRIWFDLVKVPRLLRSFQPHVVFSLGNFGIGQDDWPQAILFHKAQLVYPPLRPNPEVLRKRIGNGIIRNRVRSSTRKNCIVFCQTSVMARRFRETFRFEGEMGVFPNAVSTTVLKERSEESTGSVLLNRTKGKFVLFSLTRYYPHKNLEILIDIFRRYKEELKDVCCVTTIESSQHPRARKFLDDIERFCLAEHIINVGSLGQHQLPGFYRHVDGLFLPTLLESFSGTYIEAFRFGCPVVTSDLDFARVVCGDAALYFDPRSVKSAKNSIVRLRNSTSLQKELSTLGRNRLGEFESSWDKLTDVAMIRIEDFLKSPIGDL